MKKWLPVLSIIFIALVLTGCQPPTVAEVEEFDVIQLQQGDILPVLPKEASATFTNGRQGKLAISWDVLEGHEGSAQVWEDMTIKGYIKSGLGQHTVTQLIEVAPPEPSEAILPPFALDENKLHAKLPLAGEVNFEWSGLGLSIELYEELQMRFFCARYITHVFVFGDLFIIDGQGTPIIKGDYTYFPVSQVGYFDTYDSFERFIRHTYTPHMADLFLQDEKHLFSDGKLYAVDFGWGTTTVDTGVYEAKVLAMDDRKIAIQLTIERLTGEPEAYYNNVSDLEFQLIDGEWLISKQEFEVG